MIATSGTEQPQVLVVDDEIEILRLLSRFLTEKRYRVDIARSGEEALAFLEHQRVEVVLLDLHMPGLGGLETLRAIRERKAASSVIVISGTTDQSLAKASLAEGAADYVVKPMELDYLDWCLKQVLLSQSV